ncbi:hypothetical protein HDF09_003153 [Edaphobacter lichenicola]|uniref:DUF4188 domain-containing protein n=2 Tax=Tunturiibacter empetritectus TaxID=3069691 RepID=A0A7W8ILD0_9BACT|nr:hypothetical protein [Edaphobacter lichenicola]
MIQYWRSFDQLVDYAQSRNAAHLPAWKAFNQSVGDDGSVGIWHETYQVAAGKYESIYANMPASASPSPAPTNPRPATPATPAPACSRDLSVGSRNQRSLRSNTHNSELRYGTRQKFF